jgi:hypothetical protein
MYRVEDEKKNQVSYEEVNLIYVVEAVWTCQSSSIDGRSTMWGDTFTPPRLVGTY